LVGFALTSFAASPVVSLSFLSVQIGAGVPNKVARNIEGGKVSTQNIFESLNLLGIFPPLYL
jgi:hypothetical protein